ncbi:hypothetical protein [Calothrix sp. CCY 0018]|uniref:hypothetical protein n=1 Tax=Calothrix sp. CCY 0018 TaxID=3103864 RepID=UPI0039C5CF7F
MLIKTLNKSLLAKNTKISQKQVFFWFSLSLIFAAGYAMLGLQQAFASEYVVQDDARQHVFWMLRFVDPNLFPDDLIADYFQSVAPVGYSNFYRAFAVLGINPLLLNKLLPLVLGLIATGYCFAFCLQILPLPITAFMATLMFNQNIWRKDDLVSATPRAFIYPLFLAFLFYLCRKSLFPCLVTIIFLGFFYPQYVFICAGILVIRLWDFSNGIRFSQQKHNYIFCAAGLGVAFLVLLPYALKSSEYAPIISVAQAKQLTEFYPKGRSSFFNDNTFDYFWSGRSGILPKNLFIPATYYFGLLLPILMRFRSRFSLLRKVTEEIMILPQMLLAAMGMFVAAHIFLFRLHLPSRYMEHNLRIVFCISAAITLTAILEALFSINYRQNKYSNRFLKLSTLLFTAFISVTLLFYYPLFIQNFPKTGYQIGEYPALYDFFQQQPKDILIASITEEVNYLPTFSQRSILIGREYAIPYHFGYYTKFRQRVVDLIQAQYSQNLADVKAFIQKYQVDFWLLESGAFTPQYIQTSSLLKQYYQSNLNQDKLVKITKDISQSLQQGNVPALSKTLPNCTVAKVKQYTVLDAKCIVNQ